MGIWKDLLFLGGHVATPAGLAALGPAPAGEAARDADGEANALCPGLALPPPRPAL